jgi:hypothetical protein
MGTYPIRIRALTRGEYDQLIAQGTFHPEERLELLGGQLVVREPQGSRHAVAIELAPFGWDYGAPDPGRGRDDLAAGGARRAISVDDLMP